MQLDPPSGALLCGPAMWAQGQVNPVVLDCGTATVMSVDFASFGTATGTCGAYAASACSAPDSLSVVQSKCVGNKACSLSPSDFSSVPCSGAYLAVQVKCSDYPAARHTYWNFTDMDALVLDFWTAVNGDISSPIPSFSTQPTWLYSPSQFAYVDDADVPFYGYDRGTAPAVNGTALGDYYGRVLSWYTQGGFVDEYGQGHTGGHYLNFTRFEVFNEPDYEHGHTPVSYTVDFDNVVAGIRRWADPSHKLQFVGMCLPNIDDTDIVVQWATYFLNASNHAPACADARNWIGYHAYPTESTFTPDPTTFAAMFDYVDDFVSVKVPSVDAVISELSPGTLTALDETGCDMDQVVPCYLLLLACHFQQNQPNVSLFSLMMPMMRLIYICFCLQCCTTPWGLLRDGSTGCQRAV